MNSSKWIWLQYVQVDEAFNCWAANTAPWCDIADSANDLLYGSINEIVYAVLQVLKNVLWVSVECQRQRAVQTRKKNIDSDENSFIFILRVCDASTDYQRNSFFHIQCDCSRWMSAVRRFRRMNTFAINMWSCNPFRFWFITGNTVRCVCPIPSAGSHSATTTWIRHEYMTHDFREQHSTTCRTSKWTHSAKRIIIYSAILNPSHPGYSVNAQSLLARILDSMAHFAILLCGSYRSISEKKN